MAKAKKAPVSASKASPSKPTMKAMVFYEKETLKLEEKPIPEPADDEVLVRVEACGMCGSDLNYYFGISSLETKTGKGPLVLGHEFTGTVIKVGTVPNRLGLFKEGDRVVLDPVQSCNTCDQCIRGFTNLCTKMSVLGVSTNGGFAEYCVSKYTGTKRLPDNVSFEHGAITEPLACATYAVQNLDVQPGQVVVVYGPGPIGFIMTQLIKASGAGHVVVVGTRDYRLELCKTAGAATVLNPKEASSAYYCPDVVGKMRDLTGGRMAERAILATSSVPAMEQALEITGKKSVVVYFGLPGDKDVVRVPALRSMFGDKTIRFSWLAPFTWPTALNAISTGLVNLAPLVTHRFSVDKVENALQLLSSRQNGVMKALVKPNL
ncbi:MAG: alcohol dehydrogenase catalytic domain-containing protein [Planctomycetes bacterium]|nr:alcohol dehydrogenase catalytic domain-containing protein [Planctomycetota bacterium]